MNNLKRVLSLALSTVMLVGMMAVGASAADFTDADKIEHDDAVNTLVALKVINGQDDGSFNPEGDVTRAQMAKMIAVAMNGGSETTTGVKTTATYTDIKGHWAESYIEYCADLGIISGRGDGTFDPEGKVTGLEAAKMVLTALGYDATAYQLTGAKWAARTDELARAADPALYEDLGGIVMANQATRDTAAQLIWNGLQNKTRSVTPSTSVTGGEVTWQYNVSNQTMLKARYDADVWVGNFVGNADFGSDKAKDGEIDVDGRIDGERKSNGDLVDTENAAFPSDLDIAFVGEEVKVIFKDGKNGTKGQPDKNDTIYGVFVTGTSKVVNAIRGDVDNNKSTETKIKVDGTKYSLADTVKVWTNYATDVDYTADQLKGNSSANSALTDALKKANGDTIKLVLNAENEVETIYVTEYKLAKVSAKNSEKITLTNSFGSVKIADNDIYEDVAKDDVVVVARLYDASADDGYTVVKEAEVVSGTVDGFKGTDTVTVDGETYDIFEGTATLAGVKDTAIEKFANGSIGEDFDLYMVNGYVAAAVQTSESASNYSLVTDVSEDATAGSVLNGLKIQVMGSDGTKTILTVSKDSVDKTQAAVGGKYPAIVDDTDIAEGDIVTYSVNKNNEAKIEKVGAVAAAGADTDYTSKTKSFDGETISSECVLFVNVSASGTDYKAYDLRSLGDFTVASGDDLTVVTDNEVVAVYADLGEKPAGATTTTVYGIVSKDNGNVKVDGTAYGKFTVDVNDEQHTVYTNETLAEGDLVELDLTSDNIYTSSELKVVDDAFVTAESGVVGYVTKYSERDNTVTVNDTVTKNGDEYEATGTSTVYAIDKDTKVYYVDKDGKKGVVGSIAEFDVLKGTKNIIVFAASDKTADVILFETSNEKDILGAAAASHTHTWTDVAEVPATCTTAGTKAYKECKVAGCDKAGKKFSDEGTTEILDLTIAALGHSVSTWAEDSGAGDHKGTCDTCSSEVHEAHYKDAAGDWDSASTGDTCKVCNATKA